MSCATAGAGLAHERLEITRLLATEGGMRLLYLALILLSGCATRGVRCDAHLSPINPPAPPASREDPNPPVRDLP
jgi:hypothetical protein